MNAAPALASAHLRTYNTIFQHPISHNLEWRAVRSLFESIGNVNEAANGKLKITRNGQSLVLNPSGTKDVAEADEVMELRHFLERSEPAATGEEAKTEHWLLVIDHQEARIFRSQMHGSLPQVILPHAPEDYFRHAHNSKGTSRGKEKPEPNSFFEPVAKALSGELAILVFGTGTGTSSEMEQFVTWAKSHRPALAKRIVGTLTIDEHHLTESQLLAKAREFYAAGASESLS